MNNAAVVLETVEVLRQRGWSVSDEAVRKGLAGHPLARPVRGAAAGPGVHRGRGPQPPRHPGHGGRALSRLFPGRKITFVTGVMADKDVEHILGLIVPLRISSSPSARTTPGPWTQGAGGADRGHGRQGHGLRQRAGRCGPAAIQAEGPTAWPAPWLPLYERRGPVLFRKKLKLFAMQKHSKSAMCRL